MNWNGKYVSIQNIIAKAYREMGMADQIDIADAVEYAGDAMEMIGSPFHLIDKVESVVVTNYKALIPCDLYYIETIKGAVVGDPTADPCTDEHLNYTPMRYSTDAFHHWRCTGSTDHNCNSSLTYKVNDNYVFPNFETGRILIAYRAIPIDEQGYPKIPDDIKFRTAVTNEIKWRLGFIEWKSGKMRDAIYQKLEQERDWAIGAAQTRSNMPSIDMAESIKNNWLRLIPKINQHASGFKSAGDAEQRYTHNSGNSGGNPGSSSDNNDTFFNNGQPFVMDPNS